MSGARAKHYLTEYQEKTKRLLDEYLAEKEREAKQFGVASADLVHRISKTARLGKRIRGALLILGYQLAGGHTDAAILQTSLFLELCHYGLLVHDDIFDGDPLRRGLPSLHVQRGVPQAVNAGDLLIYYSWEVLYRSCLPPERITKAAQLYSHFLIQTLHGQVLDVSSSKQRILDEKIILTILKDKSGVYTCVAPLLIGATLARDITADEKKILTQYGLALGWVFQIQDDILGMFGDEKETGKPVGSDLRQGKNTLLMLHLFAHGTPAQKAFQKQVWGNKKVTNAQVRKMQQTLKESGSYDYAVNLAKKYLEEGTLIIPKITQDKELQEILVSLLDFMLERVV